MRSRELAALADDLWCTKNTRKQQPVATVTTAVEDLADNVAAIKFAGGKKAEPAKQRGKYNRGGGGGGSQRGKARARYICDKHWRFGDDAHFCQDPSNCQYSGN